jgi:hypothetical protein
MSKLQLMYKPNLTLRILKIIQEVKIPETCDVEYLYNKIYLNDNIPVPSRTKRNRKQRIISSLKNLSSENYIILNTISTIKNTKKYIIKIKKNG